MIDINIDRTDEEREELVKQWISDYWLYVVAVVALAIGIVYGINHFQQSKINALSGAAESTEQVSEALAENDIDGATQTVKSLQTNQTKTSFSTLATLTLAKKLFDEGQFTQAAEQYDWVISSADNGAMRDIARLRKARALSNVNQNEAAITTLNQLEESAYVVEGNLLKADIYLADKQWDKALTAYQNLQNEDSALNPQVIERRINLLNIQQQKSQQ